MQIWFWKKQKESWEPAWDSPWGKGRPGWHIECSAMAKSILGETIDIHAGGEDLQFPHHENEIAQSETLTGKTFAKYWMHNGMINVDNEKMSKSLGNFFLVREIAEKYDREIIRLWLLSAHYRNPINFSEEVMDHTKNALDRLYNAKLKLNRLSENESSELDQELKEKMDQQESLFIRAMDDDLNTADAVSHIFDLVSIINTSIDENTSIETVNYAKEMFTELTEVLGLLYRDMENVDGWIEDLIQERQMARKNKDFQRADEIRDELLAEGIELEDTRSGVVWKRRD